MRLFDTTFIIDLTRSDEGAKKLAKVVDAEGSVAAMSVVSIHEYFLGVYMKYFHDKELLSKKIEAAEKQISAFLALPLTRDIAFKSAELQSLLARRGQAIGINDLYIAATAVVHKASVVTRNIDEFSHVQEIVIERY